jgi:hypothetical protein
VLTPRPSVAACPAKTVYARLHDALGMHSSPSGQCSKFQHTAYLFPPQTFDQQNNKTAFRPVIFSLYTQFIKGDVFAVSTVYSKKRSLQRGFAYFLIFVLVAQKNHNFFVQDKHFFALKYDFL